MKRVLISAVSLVAVFVLVLASGTVGRMTAPASAGAIVDPNTLQPVPPNATCREAGGQVICDTFVVEEGVNEPIADFDLPCGTIYETFHFRGDGTRWYVDGKAVRRHVAASAEGTWSLSPTGAGPTVRLSQDTSEWTVWTTPGDDSTMVTTRNSGSGFKISAPGFGVILHDAGLTYPDGTHHGITPEFPFKPEIEAALCDALTS